MVVVFALFVHNDVHMVDLYAGYVVSWRNANSKVYKLISSNWKYQGFSKERSMQVKFLNRNFICGYCYLIRNSV